MMHTVLGNVDWPAHTRTHALIILYILNIWTNYRKDIQYNRIVLHLRRLKPASRAFPPGAGLISPATGRREQSSTRITSMSRMPLKSLIDDRARRVHAIETFIFVPYHIADSRVPCEMRDI